VCAEDAVHETHQLRGCLLLDFFDLLVDRFEIEVPNCELAFLEGCQDRRLKARVSSASVKEDGQLKRLRDRGSRGVGVLSVLRGRGV